MRVDFVRRRAKQQLPPRTDAAPHTRADAEAVARADAGPDARADARPNDGQGCLVGDA